MIHYHGGPITPVDVAVQVWAGRHGFVSFAHPDQIALAAEACASFALDNGAFTAWRKGKQMDFEGFSDWYVEWRSHPGFDFALIPDSIDGGEQENDRLIAAWMSDEGSRHDSVPVWHLHEGLDRLDRLVGEWPRVALGSSGEFSRPGSRRWWMRMHEAMGVACDSNGRPRTKLHGLRMLDPTLFSHLPLASADSTAVARNFSIDRKWTTGSYRPMGKKARAMVLVSRIEAHASAARYAGTMGAQRNFELVG